MPSAGDSQWRKSGKLTTKKNISEAYKVAVTHSNWAGSMAVAMAASPAILPTLFGALVTLCSLVPRVYYSTYATSIKKVLNTIEGYGANTRFHVEQKFKWHAGKRSWRPLNTFRVVKD